MLNRDVLSENNNEIIHESMRIKDFLNYIHEDDNLGIFDIDNTLMESKSTLGSDQWFMKLMKFAFAAAPSKETESLVIAIYHALHQYHTEMQNIELDAIQMIRELQEKNIPLIGLTARGKEISDATILQLKNCGIQFLFQKTQQEVFGITVDGVENAALYQNGIIFCSGLSKGKCLQAFFDTIQWQPSHVVMVDDKLKHLCAIAETILPKGSQFDGIRYGYLDQKVEQFEKDPSEMKAANLQLLDAYHKFPEHAKAAVKKIFLFEPRKKEEKEVKESETLSFGKWF